MISEFDLKEVRFFLNNNMLRDSDLTKIFNRVRVSKVAATVAVSTSVFFCELPVQPELENTLLTFGGKTTAEL
jgi:hypothetical protein